MAIDMDMDVEAAISELSKWVNNEEQLPQEIISRMKTLCHEAYYMLQQRLSGKARLDISGLNSSLESIRAAVETHKRSKN